MEWVEKNNKPDLSKIDSYFQKRLQRKNPVDSPSLEVSKDTLGNTLYTSEQKTEKLLHGDYPATLIVSPKGKLLITHNPHLLSQVAEGNVTWEQAGQGDEGNIYRVPLMTNDGQTDFALKYTFPIHNAGELGASDIYTPGVDQMRVMQLAERDNPVPGLRFAVPQLATLDITLAPFIKDSLPSTTFHGEQKLSEETQKQLVDIVGQKTLGEMSSEFMTAYFKSTMRTKKRLQAWFEAKNDLPVISEHLVYDDTSKNPFLVSIPALYELYTKQKEAPTLLSVERRQEFDEAVSQCLTVTELVVGVS